MERRKRDSLCHLMELKNMKGRNTRVVTDLRFSPSHIFVTNSFCFGAHELDLVIKYVIDTAVKEKYSP